LIYKQLGQEIVAAKTFSFAAMMKAFLKVDPFKCILCGVYGFYSRVESRSISASDRKYRVTEANLKS
jgi:hypothetical protein